MEGLKLHIELGSKQHTAESLEGFAELAAVSGETERASRLMGAADAVRQVFGVTAAQLKRHRMFFGVEIQMPGDVAMQQCTRGDHFGVQQGVA